SRLADRTTRHGLIAAACGTIAATMVAFWWLYSFPWEWVRVLFYVWVSIVYVALVSQFWSFANHLLDPRQAKRLFGVIGAGGLLGAVAGGQVARLAAVSVGTRGSLLAAAAILIAAVGLVLWAARHHGGAAPAVAAAPAPGERLERARGGLAVIRGSRHLQAITLIMVLTVMVAQVVDLQFNWAVERATSTLEQRTAFFGNFFTVMGVSAFLFQMLFTARIHRALGVGFALRVLPTTMGVGTVALFAAATASPALLLSAAFVLKVGENGLRHSLDQATRELLFLPVPGALRMKAKAFIDVFVQRGAKGLIALLLLPVTFGLFSPVQAGWLSVVLIVLWLAAGGWAYREYISSFRAGLKRRTVDTVMPVDLADARTLEILVEALGSADARQVLHSLDILAANGRGRLVPPMLLYHDLPEVRRRTLEVLAASRRRDAVPLVERCLGDPEPEVRAVAARALAQLEARGLAELMRPHLRDPDPRVRAAAVTCLAEADLPADREAAAAALEGLLSDADAGARREAAKALGALPEPRFQPELMQLLYDRDPAVVREGVAAVQRRPRRDGSPTLYVPTLVSLLRDRRLKHDAREALVTLGPGAVPLLGRFLEDPREDLWVRRALPKTLARIGGTDAARVLLEALERRDDAFLVRKLVEALPALPEADRRHLARGRIAEQLRREAQGWALAFTRLVSLGLEQRGTLQGPVVQWLGTDPGPELVEQLLAERLEEHLGNLFGLLAVHHPAAPMRGAHRSLVSGQARLRSHALEYLDNTLAGEERRWTFAVIDDCPVDEKLRRLEKLFGARPLGRARTLAGAIEGGSGEGVEARDLAVLALYAAHIWGLRELLGAIRDLAREGRDPMLAETASWVEQRLSAR
ncbi:MAG TPA: Npt1/Npt2 family nucleotide transporter, partial [Thermoanaerobaculia bacterium]|nr:Npt1/Npt2 family nucleotide transporter [Thermoanaerobaculia bacterium]